MARILIIDDEEPLLRNLAGYLGSLDPPFEVSTATSGEDGLQQLERGTFDLLLTDVRLPGIDGIDLLPHALALQPRIKVVVMTAFATPRVRDLALRRGAIRFLDKPLELDELRELLLDLLQADGGWSGVMDHLELSDLIQLMVLARRTRGLEVALGERVGVLFFENGHLVHASCPGLEGEAAFLEISSWRSGRFEEIAPAQAGYRPNVKASTTYLLMEAARLQDETNRDRRRERAGAAEPVSAPRRTANPSAAPDPTEPAHSAEEEALVMAVKEHLEKFAAIEGFRAVGVFTSQGEILESFTQGGGKIDINSIGMFANNALLNAQKATDQMGVGRGNLLQIRAPKANLMMRCLNEATDFAATKAGKAHFHTVVVMDPEGNGAMAKMILDNIVESIAEELR